MSSGFELAKRDALRINRIEKELGLSILSSEELEALAKKQMGDGKS